MNNHDMNNHQSTNAAPTAMTDQRQCADMEEARVFTNYLYRTRLQQDAWPMNLNSIIGAKPPSFSMVEGLDPRGAAFSAYTPMQIEQHPQILRPNLRSTSNPTRSQSSLISRFGKNTANDDMGSTATLNTEGGSGVADVNIPRSLRSLVSTQTSLSHDISASRAGVRLEVSQGIEGGATTDRDGDVTRGGTVVSCGTRGGEGMGVLVKGDERAPASAIGTNEESTSARGGGEVSRLAARRKSSESVVSQSTMGGSGSTKGMEAGVPRNGSGSTQMCSGSASGDPVENEPAYTIAVMNQPPMATGMCRIEPSGFKRSSPVSLWERQGSEVESWNPPVKKPSSVNNTGEQDRSSHVPENSVQFRPSDVAKKGWDRVTTSVTSYWRQRDRIMRMRSERRRNRELAQEKRRERQPSEEAEHVREVITNR
jgi:hypothetical protein